MASKTQVKTSIEEGETCSSDDECCNDMKCIENECTVCDDCCLDGNPSDCPACPGHIKPTCENDCIRKCRPNCQYNYQCESGYCCTAENNPGPDVSPGSCKKVYGAWLCDPPTWASKQNPISAWTRIISQILEAIGLK